jgi:hypothetical protein
MHRHMVERCWMFHIQEIGVFFGNWKEVNHVTHAHRLVTASSDKDNGRRRGFAAKCAYMPCRTRPSALPLLPLCHTVTKETGRRMSGTWFWTGAAGTVRRRSSSAALRHLLFFLPPSRFVCTASPVQQPRLVVRTKRNKTWPPACIFKVILGFISTSTTFPNRIFLNSLWMTVNLFHIDWTIFVIPFQFGFIRTLFSLFFCMPTKCRQAVVRLHYFLIPLQVSRMNRGSNVDLPCFLHEFWMDISLVPQI